MSEYATKSGAELTAVPDRTAGRWLVHFGDAALRLTYEQYDALKRAAVDDPAEAMQLAPQRERRRHAGVTFRTMRHRNALR